MATQPDTPCIGVCSTAVGDDVCLGCARTFGEIGFWLEMTAAQKAVVWARLPIRKVWLALARELGLPLDIVAVGDHEYGCCRLPDGGMLHLLQPYQRDGERYVPLDCNGRQLALQVSAASWPQQLRVFVRPAS